jgi:hypothetical protein
MTPCKNGSTHPSTWSKGIKAVHGARQAGAVLLAALAVACGDATSEGPDPLLDEKPAGLALGAKGPEVERLFAFLQNYGYFENESLRVIYPDWQPVVATLPEDPAVFDETMEEGLRAYQRLNGLKVTGIVDDETATLMAQPRCGHPDEDPAQRDPSRKFTRASTVWSNPNVTYTIENYPTRANTAAKRDFVYAAILAAQATWSTVSTVTWTARSLDGNIRLHWYSGTQPPGSYKDMDGPGGTLAWGYYPTNGNLHLDDAETWNVASGDGGTDTQAVVLHELGHTLGLMHSGISTAVMHPTYASGRRALTLDDINAINATYASWANMTNGGAATDIGIGPSGGTWIITNTNVAGGKTIAYNFGTTWGEVPGGAVRISVGPHIRGNQSGPPWDRPWVVNSNGNTYRQTPTGSGVDYWQTLGNFLATDIAVSHTTGQAVAIGAGTNNTKLYRYDETLGWQYWATPTGSPALKRIALSSNATWVVTTSGVIMRLFNNAWQTVPGAARDIGSNSTTTWIIGTDNVTGGGSVWVWSEQPGVAGSDIPNAVWGWYKTTDSGAGTNIAVKPDGSPWVTTSTTAIYRRSRD